MATSVELDPIFRQALKCLHSSNSDAAENIRRALDDVIKQKHGPNKMLINTLSKKYIAEESLATGSGVIKTAIRRSSNKSSDSSSSSPIQIIATTSGTSTTTTVITTDSSGQTTEIPVIISLPDTGTTNATIAAVDDNAMDTNIHNSLFDDLACVICRRIDLSAKNRLIECTKCTSLYHQECHDPQIKDSDLSNGQESLWCCKDCRKVKRFKSTSAQLTASPSKSHHSSSPSSSNSSNSDVIITGSSGAATTFTSTQSVSKSSKRDKEKDKDKEKEYSSSSSKSKSSSSSRHHSHHHSSSSSSSSSHHSSSKHERSSEKNSEKNSSSSSSKSSVTPNIHIISADKRLQNMKKKAAKTQESKRKK